MKTYIDCLDLKQTERATLFVEEFFQKELAATLNLMRVSAPLFVRADTGINDDLNGTERPVKFAIKADDGCTAVVVHSLAKWKRMALARYGCKPGEGIYTIMNAIRADEELDAIHSLHVNQFDWERVITKEDRSIEFLKTIVRKLYDVIRATEQAIEQRYPSIKAILPSDIHFIHAQELENLYPQLTIKEREHAICKKYGAVFVIGIGGDLASGTPHDGRAPDYDDWSTETVDGLKGLNGDILVWHPVLEQALELSSMGIRVDKQALTHQLHLRGTQDRTSLMFHRMLLEDKLPLCIGGGIGISRLSLFFLRKVHIGQVQASMWPDHMVAACEAQGITLL